MWEDRSPGSHGELEKRREAIWREVQPSADLGREVWWLPEVVVIYACLAVESFLNYYGVVRLGERFYVNNFERALGGTQKVAALLAVCEGTLVPANSEIIEVVQRLFARRNNLVHPKARKVKPYPNTEPPALALAKGVIDRVLNARVTLEDARASVTEMTRFFELFEEYDPEVRRVRERQEKEAAEERAEEEGWERPDPQRADDPDGNGEARTQ